MAGRVVQPEMPNAREFGVKEKPVIIVPQPWIQGLASHQLGKLKLAFASAEQHEVMLGEEQANFKFVEKLKQAGFTVINGIKADKDTKFDFVVSNPPSKAGELKIAAQVPGLRFIPRCGFEEYKRKPFLPAVVKPKDSPGGGQEKYLIENETQKNTLFDWFEELRKADYDVTKDFSFERFVETPSDRYTSYRVVMTTQGTLLAAGLLYSGYDKEHAPEARADEGMEGVGETHLTWIKEQRPYITMPTLLLEDSTSRYYLRTKKAISNIHGGGGAIPLNPTSESKETIDLEKRLLAAHGLDPEKPQLPKTLEEQAREIALRMGPKSQLLVGIDFIQDKNGGFYYLETNPGPGSQVYLNCRNKGEGDEVKGYELMMGAVIDELIQLTQRSGKPADQQPIRK